MPETHDVMTTCPEKGVPVKAMLQRPLMTAAQFEAWQEHAHADWSLDCPACGATHRITADDCFLGAD